MSVMPLPPFLSSAIHSLQELEWSFLSLLSSDLVRICLFSRSVGVHLIMPLEYVSIVIEKVLMALKRF